MRFSYAGLMVAFALGFATTNRALAQDQLPQEPGSIFTLGGSEANFDPNQPIKGGFTVSVTVDSAAGRETDLTGVFQVDPTGAIQMKLIGRVELKTLTPAQASDKAAALLKPYVKDPKVLVAIVSVPKPVIFLTGGAGRRGPVVVNDGTTLAELLTTLGFDENADLSHIRVVHKDEKGTRTLNEYDFTKWLKPLPGQKPDEGQNPVVTDRDLIYVPLKQIPGVGNVQVSGDVVRPGIVSIRVGVPTQLREVITLAGNLNATADHQQVILRRVGQDRAFVLDYDKAEQGDPVHNIEVKADDVVYVAKLDYDRFVNMNGGFVRSGKLPYYRTITLTQAISESGGLQTGARDWEGRVYRHTSGADPTRTQIIPFHYGKVRNNQQPDFVLMPGDTVEVPSAKPRTGLDPLTLATSVLTIAVLVDRLVGGNRGF